MEYLRDMSLLAAASYDDGVAPVGWNYLDLSLTDLSPRLFDGVTYANNLFYGEARVLVNADGDVTISLRGTDQLGDVVDDLALGLGLDYWLRFRPLLNALARFAPGADFTIVGHSLGGAAVHQIAEQVAGGALQAFADAHYVSFASPIQTADPLVLSYGHANDWVYGTLDPLEDRAADFDNIYLFTAERGAAQPFPDLPALTAHRIPNIHHGLERILTSGLWVDRIDLSIPIIIGTGGAMQAPRDLPGDRIVHEMILLGLDTPFGTFTDPNDVITGRNSAKQDIIDGLGGNDMIIGRGGPDWALGGFGWDYLEGGAGNDILFGGDQNDTLTGQEDGDRLYGGRGKDSLEGGRGSDLLVGGSGDDVLMSGGNEGIWGVSQDFLFGGYGRDTLMGSARDDIYLFTANDRDTIIDRGGNNTVFFSNYAVILDALDLWMERTQRDDENPAYLVEVDKPFYLSDFDPWEIAYLSESSSIFVIDAAMAAVGQTFLSADISRPSDIRIDLTGATPVEASFTLRVSNAGSSIQVASLGSADLSYSILCRDGADSISVARKVVIDALAGPDWNLGYLDINGFNASQDTFSFAPPFKSREIETWWSLRPGVYHDQDTDEGRQSYRFFEVVAEESGGTYLHEFFSIFIWP